MTPDSDGWRWVVPLLWWGVILALSSVPEARFDPMGLPSWTSYVAHVVEYGLLGAALRWAMPAVRRPVLVAVLAGLVMGGLDELWQSTVPGRQTSLVDLAVDLAAVTVAARMVGSRLLAR